MASSLASSSCFTLSSCRSFSRSDVPGSRQQQQQAWWEPVRCSGAAQEGEQTAASTSGQARAGRRHIFSRVVGTVAASSLAAFLAPAADALNAKPVEVGSYLPRAASDSDFCLFKATKKDTPALRAGNVDPYEFFVPPKWKQARIANILSGNYCQPKCAEPWLEVKFEDDRQGSLQVFAAPMVRLTNKPNAKIEEIGSPDAVISALGPFVTGNSYDPDEVVDASVKQVDEQTFYTYELDTPYAKSGAHNLACATAKGNVVLLFVVSATEQQWSASQGLLRRILDSFTV